MWIVRLKLERGGGRRQKKNRGFFEGIWIGYCRLQDVLEE